MTMSNVTAADYSGPVPVVSILCPDAGEDIKAEDIRAPVAALLANDLAGGIPARYQYSEIVAASPWAITSPNLVTGNTWTSTSITIDIPTCKTGDVLEVFAHGNWQLNATSSPGDVAGRAKPLITENVGGTPSVIATVYDQATIYDDSGTLTVPHNEPWTLTAIHTVVTGGTTRIVIQGRSQDLVGGAGTGTIVFMFAARMDVTHWRKS